MSSRDTAPVAQPRSRYSSLVTIALVVGGAGLAGKYYFDADALKSAAVEERRTAEQVMQTADREIAAAAEQVRRSIAQAAQSEVQARESAKANAQEIARIRSEMEAARRDSVAQARREAEEEARNRLAPQVDAARAAAAAAMLKLALAPAGDDLPFNHQLSQRSPSALEGLVPGGQPLKLARVGKDTPEGAADIVETKPNDTRSINAERGTGAAVVSSSPDQVEFSIRALGTSADVEPLRSGRTPAQLNDLPTGDYVVDFKLAGAPARTERITIERGLTAAVATTFQGGSVTIHSSPPGATVIQGGLVLGKTPLTLGNVPPQEMVYELSAPGYEPLKMSGAVIGGGQIELKGTLLKFDRLANEAEVRTPPRLYFATPLNLGRVPTSTPRNITASFVVRLDGSPQSIKVLEKVDRNVEKRTIEAIAKWKFYPGVSHAGYPVNVRMSMPIPLASRG